MKKNALIIGLVLGVLVLVAQTPVYAVSFGFFGIEGTAFNKQIGEDQFFMEVFGESDTTTFKFTNIGTYASSITAIYFDDAAPPLITLPMILTPSAGVAFSQDLNPNSNLPGGNAPAYAFVSDYSADADAGAGGVSDHGINNGTQPTNEWLEIMFLNNTNVSTENIVSALNSGAFRVGLHVQSFPDGGSGSFINRVPEPTTLLLLGLGLVGMAGLRRKLR